MGIKKSLGNIVVLTSILSLLVSCSTNNQVHDKGSQIQSTTRQITNVDSIKQYNQVQAKLNSNSEIIIIDHNGKDKSHYHDHQVVVHFKAIPTTAEIENYAKEIDGQLMKKMEETYIFSSNSLTTEQLISFFDHQKNVEFTEPNYILIQNEQPNDLLYNDFQWNLRMIDTENGWNFTRGAENVKIAIIDTGVDVDHPDLMARIGEGYNLLNDSEYADDDNGHGTHVAGIIASVTNNQEGIAGMTWVNPIMPVKAMGTDGYGSSFDIARGIIWATDHGADIINLSVGNYQNSKTLKHAVDYAYNHDVVMVAASGNDNTSQPSYPAAYKEVLGVAAVDLDGNRANFSNYGKYIDVSAPGVQIPSTYIDQQYAALSGTSMAAPHVTALAALIRSLKPELSNREVMKIIKDTSIDLGKSGKDIYFGEGLIDVVAALNAAEQK